MGTLGNPADPNVFRVTIDNQPIPLVYGDAFAETATFVDFEFPFRLAQAGRETPFGNDAPAADLDEFAVYTKLLSDAEIADHYNNLATSSLLPGDFNGSGSVTPADFMILNNNLAAHLDRTIGFSDGDFDFDGDVDLDDFGQFKEIYPVVVATALGVPEPASWGVCALGSVVLLSFRRQRQAGVR